MRLLPVILVVCTIVCASAFSFEFRSDEDKDPTSSDQGKTIFDFIGKTRIGHYVVLLCRFLRLLNDQPTSSKYFDMMNGALQIIQQARPCIEKSILESLSDNSNFYGRSVSLLRYGEEPLTKMQQLWEISPLSVWSAVWAGMMNFKVEEMLEDNVKIMRKMSDSCFTGDLSKYKEDVDFMINAFETKVMNGDSREM